MDQIFSTFVNATTIFICLATYIVTYVIRTATEALWPGIKTKRLWNELYLPLGAIVNGALMGLMSKTFLWPDVASKTLAGRMFYGAICGMFCAFVYSRVRSWVSAKELSMTGKNTMSSKIPEAPPSDVEGEEVVDDAPLGGKPLVERTQHEPQRTSRKGLVPRPLCTVVSGHELRPGEGGSRVPPELVSDS